jgi:hypothetical protein
MHARLLFLIVLVLTALTIFPSYSESNSETCVKAHVKKSGKPVSAHKRKSPNKAKLDNYGTKGNVNPYTGKVGKDDHYSGKRQQK